MAHNEPQLLDALLKALDDKRNDIFIHIDVTTICGATEPVCSNKGS